MPDVGLKLKFGAVDKVSKTLGAITRKVKPLRNEVRRATNSFRLFQDRTASVRKALRKTGQSISSAGKKMSMGVTAPLAGIGYAMFKTAADFEASMNKVQALTRASGEDFKRMRNLARELGASTTFSASEAADAMSFLGMAGWKTNQILEATPALLSLSAASNTELARSADIVSNVMGAFGLQAKDATRVADLFAAATSSANVDMEMIAESMKQAAPLAKQFGASVEDTTAAIGLLGNVGIQGSKAGTAMQNAFLNLSGPTSKAAKVLEGLGVNVSDSRGNMRRFSDIMGDLGGQLANLPQKARLQALNAVFGKIGISAAANLQEVGKTGELERFSESMKNVSGTADRMAKTMSKGAGGGLKAMKSAFDELAITIGDTGLLQDATRLIKKITETLRAVAKSNPNILKMGVAFAMVAAAIGPLLILLGMMTSGLGPLISMFGLLKTVLTFLATKVLIPLLIGSIKILIGLFIKLGIAMMATPIGWLIAGVAALGVGAYMLIKHWGKVKTFFGGLWDWVVEKFEWAMGKLSISNLIPDFVKDLLPNFTSGPKKANLGANKPGAGNALSATRAQNSKSNVVVDFKNPPRGTKIKTESDKGTDLSVNTGLQGAAAL